MTIFQHGNEFSAWDLAGEPENVPVSRLTPSTGHSTSADSRDADFSRAGMGLDNDTGVIQTRPAPSPQNEVWVHGRIALIGSATAIDDPAISVQDDNGVDLVMLGSNNGTADLRVAGPGGGPATTAAVTAQPVFPTTNGFSEIDLRVLLNGAESVVQVFVNRVLVIDYTGSVGDGSGTGLSTARFFSLSGTGGFWSELIFANEPTIGLRVFSLNLTGNGDISDFTGDINSASSLSPNPVPLTSTNSGDEHSFDLSEPIAALAGLNPLSVSVSVEAQRSSDISEPQNLSTGLRIAGQNFLQLKNLGDAGLVKTNTVFQFTNPATGLPWTLADLAGLQAVVRAEP